MPLDQLAVVRSGIRGMQMQHAACVSTRISVRPLPFWAVPASVVAFLPSALAQTFTTLHTFSGPDGAYPYSGLVQAAAGGYVGTTRGGGASNGGVVFVLAADGSATTLHSFCAAAQCTDGSQPVGGLVQGQDGDFYGTTYAGGASGYGTVFALSVGLSPFIETQPKAGTIGTAVRILGDNLTGTTQLFFNDQPAAFKIVSASEIVTVVPSGAATGIVEVVTSGGILGTNINFAVY